MSVCVPKHVVCGWYTPDFVASSESCSLPTSNETFGKAPGGGTFFRSLEQGSHVNSINIVGTYQVGTAGSPADWREYSPSASPFDAFTDIVGLKIVVTYSTTTETYYVDQEALGESPDVGWSTNGITSLRSQVSSSSALISLPLLDNNGGWDQSTDEDNHLGPFDVTLSGGSGAPVTDLGSPVTDLGSPVISLGSIRTGPYYTMYHIADSENDSGDTYTANAIRYWNGAAWKAFTNDGSDCEDPNNPPTDCGLGPS